MTSGFVLTSAGVPSAILRPRSERDHSIRDRHHQTHMMFDEKQRYMAVVADTTEQRAELLNLMMIEAAGGLIEQQ